VKLGDLAELAGVRLEGDPRTEIHSVSTLRAAGPGSIAFLSNYKYRQYLTETRASAVILSEELFPECPAAALVSENPYVTYARVASALYPVEVSAEGAIHPSAVVAEDAELHASVTIGPHCVVESGAHLAAGVVLGPACVVQRDCYVGEDTRLVARVTLCHQTRLGARCLIHPGAVLGSDGFGLANDRGVWLKIPQIGRVVLGDDVEVGANTTIDRGAIEDTEVEDGVKLDNQIQLGHNVRVGAHSLIAGCAGISGSVTIGRQCTIGGGAGFGGHIDLTDNVVITGFSRVSKSISEPGTYTSGTPLQKQRDWQRNTVRYRQLEKMAQRLSDLEKKLKD